MSNNKYTPIAICGEVIFYWTECGVWIGVIIPKGEYRLVNSPFPIVRMWLGGMRLRVVNTSDAERIKKADAIIKDIDYSEIANFSEAYSVEDRIAWKEQAEKKLGVKLEFNDAPQS